MEEPPPTKWTISRRSPSLSSVSGQRSRGTMSRLSSTATRSDFISNASTKPASVKSAGGDGSAKTRSSPLMCTLMACVSSESILLGFAQGELAGHGAAFVVGLHHHGGVGQSGLLDFHRDWGATRRIGDCLGIE